ncbi:uncharacterized protein LOC115741585 [Rhodamnia argentea]|uniref:Uncharacterized protein LOC115741585 n=1 Tax=Rhodamnia argentea TaxID=178133 RepID=A0A8B8P9W1_9MYRT|nr:uncharacterized protein LOC115741585 [Rhodamnia argentea]
MGCGSSKVGFDDEDHSVPLGVRSQLRHRIQSNIRMRKRRSKHCSTLSTMQLLPKGSLESSKGTSSPNSSCANTHDHHRHAVEDKKVADANCHSSVANASGVNHSSTTLTRSEDEEGVTEDKMVVEAVTAAIEEAIMVEAEVELELEEDDYIIEVLEEGRGSLVSYAELDAYPGSPSFRIYCISSILEDDIEQLHAAMDEETYKDTTSLGGDANAKEASNDSISDEGGGTGGKGKRRSKMKKVVTIIARKRGSSGAGRQQRKVTGKKVMNVKHLLSLNVKSCYIPTCSTKQIDHSTRLLPNNPNTTPQHPS